MSRLTQIDNLPGRVTGGAPNLNVPQLSSGVPMFSESSETPGPCIESVQFRNPRLTDRASNTGPIYSEIQLNSRRARFMGRGRALHRRLHGLDLSRSGASDAEIGEGLSRLSEEESRICQSEARRSNAG